MSRFALLALLPILAACATPRQNCETAALKDLQTIDALIAETEQNIARGYGIEVETVRSTTFRYCLGRRSGGNTSIGMIFCNEPEFRTIERPVALDLADEEAKLRSLRAKRVSTAKEAARAVAMCRQQHPEG
ncbi:hypothetical protein [Actibacterium pelagium]|uniref:Lipoprotein n=1 Tax=Actibacterium pelagium TaxID=2029103 RepID=A0A917EJ93_9RHOB|nr:hypothetical protein [Actibacterium pelagium]GGE50119.1 hypothetical protein GCM10011517_17380 [Actibacterium pelagium]